MGDGDDEDAARFLSVNDAVWKSSHAPLSGIPPVRGAEQRMPLELALRQSHSRLESVAHAGLLSFIPDGGFLDIKPRAGKIFDRP